MADAAAVNAADVRAYVLHMLRAAEEMHDREARYVAIIPAEKHEYAAMALRILHDQVEALPGDHPAFEEMAGMCTRTECRCQRKDDEFFDRLDYTATGYETAGKMLDAMLINYRRVDRQEAAAQS